LLQSSLTDFERDFIERRIAEEEAAVSALAFEVWPPISDTKGLRMTEQRIHFKQALSLKQRLLNRVRSLRDEANSINPGLDVETEAGQFGEDGQDPQSHQGSS
jgi:hypothetical protein